MVLFPDSDGAHKALMRAESAEDGTGFTFTMETPFLQRMGSDDDNGVSLAVDGTRYCFKADGRGPLPSSVTILENSNKRSRYRISFTLPVRVPFTLSAEAEGLELI